MLVFSALGMQKLVNLYEFKATLVSSRAARAVIQRKTVLKTKVLLVLNRINVPLNTQQMLNKYLCTYHII